MKRSVRTKVFSAAVLGATSIAFSGCDKTATEPPSIRKALTPSVSAPNSVQTIARAIALAMNDENVRFSVRNAMRKSELNEYKLVLQDFARTPEGAQLLSASAASLQTTQSQLASTIANLPSLDFYVPFEAHRLSWNGSSDIIVATTFDPDAAVVTAYGTSGQIVTLEKANGVPTSPLIMLHPAEPKSVRSSPQVDTPGKAYRNRLKDQ